MDADDDGLCGYDCINVCVARHRIGAALVGVEHLLEWMQTLKHMNVKGEDDSA